MLPWWLSGKEFACNAGDLCLTPGSGRSPGGGHRNPLEYSCLENPMDRGTWQAPVHRVAKSQIGLNAHIQLVFQGYRGLHCKVIILGRVQDKQNHSTFSIFKTIYNTGNIRFFFSWRHIGKSIFTGQCRQFREKTEIKISFVQLFQLCL